MNFIKFTTKSEVTTSKPIRKKLLFILFLILVICFLLGFLWVSTVVYFTRLMLLQKSL